MALTGMAVMAALALAKNQMIDQPAADRKRKYEATTAALSPWTGMKSEYVQDPNAIGAMMSGAGAGAAMGSQLADSNLSDSLAGNPAVSGATNASPLGGDAMSAQLGSKASDFAKASPSSWSGVGADPSGGSWKPMAASGDSFYMPGSSQDPNAQNSWASLQNPQDPYKTLHAAGKSEKNPEDAWQINPFKANY